MSGASVERRHTAGEPLVSICIPQHNRTSFLLEVLRSVEEQTFRDIEVCISDDCSTDGRQDEVVMFLQRSSLSFAYARQPRNLRYDANLRASISLARGTYCLLLGNDDALASRTTLAEYVSLFTRSSQVGVATANFVHADSGRVVRRVRETVVLRGGPATAARVYRNFSFVSGVVVRRDRAQHHATDRWDGAEMYQTFLACRIIAEGWHLAYADQVVTRMGISVPGETVDSVTRRPRLNPCPIVERRLPLVEMGRLATDAIQPYASDLDMRRHAEWILAQLYLFPYAYWLFTYRRIQSWNYAAGIALGMRPRNALRGIRLGPAARVRLALLHACVSAAGLLVPIRLFETSRGALLDLAKRLT